MIILYNSHFTGSSLWDLFSKETKKVENSWSEQIQKTQKTVARHLLENIKYDVRSTTGSNLRKIMHLLQKDSIDDICKSDVNNIVFSPIPKNEEWRIGFLKELLDIRSKDVSLENFSKDEIEDMIQHVCTT